MTILNKDLRRRILEKGAEMKNGHLGPSLSCLDCVKYLYDHILREEVDLFIMSKGHGEMALFSVLESKGKKPNWTLHLNYNEEEGIYATTGSLGHGLPIGLGRALAKRIKGEDGNIYVLLGDGEMEEGSNWEALTLANRFQIDNLTLLIDYNKYQAVGKVKKIANIDNCSLSKRLEAFGCKVKSINGHDEKELSKLKYLKGGLNAIILDTVKGKGVKLLEENHAHVFYLDPNMKEYKNALKELK